MPTVTLYDCIDRLWGWTRDNNVPPHIQVMKISEEVGEAVQAYLGFLGANPRKGVTNGIESVSAELADVVITTPVAMHSFGDPEAIMGDRLSKVMGRIGVE